MRFIVCLVFIACLSGQANAFPRGAKPVGGILPDMSTLWQQEGDSINSYSCEKISATSLNMSGYWPTLLALHNNPETGFSCSYALAGTDRYGAVSAVAGARCDQRLAALDGILAANPPSKVIINNCGSNDITNNRTPAQILADDISFIEKVQASGRIPAFYNIIPRYRCIDWNANTTTCAAMKVSAQQVNANRLALCKDKKLLCLDIDKSIADAEWNAPAKYFRDGNIHLNKLGYITIARYIDQKIGFLMPYGPSYETNAITNYNASTAPQGNLVQGSFSNAGGNGAVSYTTQTGTLPTAAEIPYGWTFTCQNCANSDTNVSVTKTASGNHYKLKFTFTTSGTMSEYETWMLTKYTITPVAFGDFIEGRLGVSYHQGTEGLVKGASFLVKQTSGVQVGAEAVVDVAPSGTIVAGHPSEYVTD